MNHYIQLFVFVILALLTLLACHLFPNASADHESGLIMWLPDEFGLLEGERVSVSPQEAKTLPGDTEYLKMSYSPPREFGRSPGFWEGLSATLILSGTDRRSLHEPEICLDAQGWEIERRVPITVETSAGPLEVMNLELGQWMIDSGNYLLDENGDKIRLRAHYLYWWVAKDRSTAFTNQRVLKTVLDNFLRNKNSRWGYPSVLVFADPRRPSAENYDVARQRGLDFIRVNAPMFQKSLGAKVGGEVQEKGRVAPSF